MREYVNVAFSAYKKYIHIGLRVAVKWIVFHSQKSECTKIYVRWSFAPEPAYSAPQDRLSYLSRAASRQKGDTNGKIGREEVRKVGDGTEERDKGIDCWRDRLVAGATLYSAFVSLISYVRLPAACVILIDDADDNRHNQR